MKDLLTIIVSIAAMCGLFLYMLIGTIPPLWVSLVVIGAMFLMLMKGVINDYIR